MSDKLTIIEDSENYYLQKRANIQNVLISSNKSFLQKSYEFEKISIIKKEPTFIFLITGWIAQTSLLMQIKNPVDDFLKQDIINMLVGYWSNLSFEEIVKAFELERFGIFKEKTEHYQLFDCNYISQVLKKYQRWKREQKTELDINPKPKIEVMTDEEKEAILINGINQKYLDYKETKEIEEPFTHIFKDLIERKIIKMPNAQTPKLSKYYDDKITEATNQVLKESRDYFTEDKGKRQQNKTIIDSIISKIPNEDAKSLIEIRAKKLVLIDFFNKQIEENKDKII